jgi:hypothetical protein
MTDEKITITWEEMRTRQVEQRVSAMQAMRRNREYAQITEAAPEPSAAKFKSLWYNTAVYMTVFGLAGGLLAWICGEALHFKNSARLEAAVMMDGVKDIRRDADAGKITPQERASLIDQLARDGRKNPYFTIYVDERLSNAEKDARIAQVAQRDTWKEFISNVLAFGVCGMVIAIALSIAEPLVSRNIPSTIINGSVGATLGLLGGVAVALFVERLYHALGGQDGSITTANQIIARIAQWAVVGFSLSLAPGLVMRNAKKLMIGMIGGVLGGVVGGALFDVIGKVTHSQDISRLIGLCAIGAVAGLGSALVEVASRSGWLKVTGGLIAGKQFILYRNPTFIGSSPDNQIYLFKDPQVGRRHAAIHIVKGGFELEDLPLGSATIINGRPVARQRLRSGDQVQIGGTRFLFQEKQPSTLA